MHMVECHLVPKIAKSNDEKPVFATRHRCSQMILNDFIAVIVMT